jgi:hypothetical protein
MPQDWLKFFPDILKYGATGLSALLFFFAYLLLRKQSSREKSDVKVLREIRIYMFISVFLAMISLASSFFCTQDTSAKTRDAYTVKGKIVMSDGARPTGITIMTGYPPIIPRHDGEILGYRIWRNPGGELPVITFAAEGYFVEPVDLREFENEIKDHTIDIGSVTMTREEK